MTEDTPRVGAGDVEITILDDAGEPEVMVLRPTYNAARVLSAQSGGLMGALERVARLDMDTIVQVVQLGLGHGQQSRGPKNLPDRIWRTGLSDDSGGMAERCVTYLRVLMSGGRPPPAQEAPDPNPPAQS